MKQKHHNGAECFLTNPILIYMITCVTKGTNQNVNAHLDLLVGGIEESNVCAQKKKNCV